MLRIYCLLLAGLAAVAAETSRVEVKMPAPLGGAWKVSRFSVDLAPGATGSTLVAEVIALIREWRFEAARRGGIPIVMRGYLELELDTVAKARPRPKTSLRKL